MRLQNHLSLHRTVFIRGFGIREKMECAQWVHNFEYRI